MVLCNLRFSTVDAGLSMMKHFFGYFENSIWRESQTATPGQNTSYNEDDIDKKKGSGPDATKWLKTALRRLTNTHKAEKTFPSLSRVSYIHTNAYYYDKGDNGQVPLESVYFWDPCYSLSTHTPHRSYFPIQTFIRDGINCFYHSVLKSQTTLYTCSINNYF